MSKQILLKKTIIFILFNFAILINGCSSGTGIGDINLFSIEDDKNLGQQLDNEIRKDPNNYPIYNNTNATSYVQNILNQIIQSPEIKYRQEFSYKVTIINANTINAFATPGGYIYVYKGLLKYLDNEATLAAILAHEVAHAERRHATKRMTKAYGLQVLLGVVLGQNPSTVESIAANLFSGLALLYNSREDEYEADEYSFRYLKSTIWYPGAGIFFFEKIKDKSEQSEFKELFSTHPLDQKRIDALNKLIKDTNLSAPTESNLFQQRYLQFKGTLN